MIVNKENKIIYHIDSLVCYPKEQIENIELFDYNFPYLFLFESSYEGSDELIEFVKKNSVKELILVDYRLEYESVIENLREQVKIGIISTIDLASLTSPFYLTQHDAIVKLYQNHIIQKIGFLDKNLYQITKLEFPNTYHISLDVPLPQDKKQSINKSGIGLLNNSEDPKHSYFNQLSALFLLNKTANLMEISPDINRFCQTFNINANKMENIEGVIQKSEVTLYINFCNSNYSYFFRSMDAGTPCIIGNSSILEQNPYLKSMLQVKSDDDINEIAELITKARNEKEKILEEYETFRKLYSNSCQKSINQFLALKPHIQRKETYEKLLTVGIPVYNVEEYVSACIESVLKAIDDDMEIIIVDDGSTDNSKEIVEKYQQQYPHQIRFIEQKNHGLGNVRNVIMKHAKGKYIASIDSDDTINKMFFKEAKPYLENDIDMIICDWLSMPTNGENFITEAMDQNLKFESDYLKLLYSTIMPSNCNKIVKKSLYETIGLTFVEGHKYEDFGTNPIIMNLVQTIAYFRKPYYEYNIRANSIMRTSAGYHMIDVLEILEKRIKTYIEDNILNYQEFVAYVYGWRIEDLIMNQLYTMEESERNKMIDYMNDHILNILKEVYQDNPYTDKLINRIDDEKTKEYIKERNEKMFRGKLKEYLKQKIEEKSFQILTPALLLYNYDNRS